MKLAWTPKSLRKFKRLIRKNPQLKLPIENTLRRLTQDPFHFSLKTHKLQGNLADCWSCSIDYQYRIIFEFVGKPDDANDTILLLNIGTHDEVY